MVAIDRLHVLGVRHHSPACARRVRARIEALRPAFVLIEGPADFNPFIDDLRAAHDLPLAIFSFQSGQGRTLASYSPFCAYSPEWQALQSAWHVDATPLFCDLPAWHPAFGERENRYADLHDLEGRYVVAQQRLMRELGAEGGDALWDTLAEQTPDEHLESVLGAYFEGIRPAGAEDPREAAREVYMGQYAAWALDQAQGRDVVVVCGGWHASAIRRHAAQADGRQPEIPVPETGAQVGSYLVPYSYARLDRFTGYASGMPSPEYYEKLFEQGPAAAVTWAMRSIAATLRGAGQNLSTADFIAWQAQAELLARLRGHRNILRVDLLDGALSTIIKEALDVPPAWAQGGRLQAGNDPLVVLMLRALSGERQGRLASGTRHPPLVADVEARANAVGIVFASPPSRVELDWHEAADRPCARFLHQLRILGLPGIRREHGPQTTDARDLKEVFVVGKHPDWLAALIEASIWGGSLEAAALARLAARAEAAKGDPEALSACIADAAFAGLLGSGGSLLSYLCASLEQVQTIGPLGRAGLRLLQLYRFGEAFETNLHADLKPLCETMFARILWLVENIGAQQSVDDVVMAALACRDLLRYGDGLDLDGGFAATVFRRCAAGSDSPPALAGAALGYLFALETGGVTMAELPGLTQRHGLPAHLGDFLAGLLALAREQISQSGELLAVIDDLVGSWAQEEFLLALPAMRGAFAWLPPRERERVAYVLLRRAGFGEVAAQGQALAWMRQTVRVADQCMAMEREARTRERLRSFGVLEYELDK